MTSCACRVSRTWNDLSKSTSLKTAIHFNIAGFPYDALDSDDYSMSYIPYLQIIFHNAGSEHVKHIVLHHPTKIHNERNALIDLQYGSWYPIHQLIHLHFYQDCFPKVSKLSLVSDSDVLLSGFTNVPVWVEILVLKSVRVVVDTFDDSEAAIENLLRVEIPYCRMVGHVYVVVNVLDKLVAPLAVHEEDAVLRAISGTFPNAMEEVIKPFLRRYVTI